MKALKQRTGRALTLVLAGAVLSSCMAHGQARNTGIETHPNFVPYDAALYENLLSGRAWIFEGRDFRHNRNLVSGVVYSRGGERLECLVRLRMDRKPLWRSGTARTKWFIKDTRFGARVGWQRPQEKPLFASFFYDPGTGEVANEIQIREKRSGKLRWIRATTGHVQDSWPRALADACPGLKLPAHIKINEKQTSLKMEELRRQDPDAPIRNFPGSHLTSPGRTGLGASRGRPTTSRKEAWNWLQSQEGYVVRTASGNGYVFVLDGGRNEVWRLGDDGGIAKVGHVRDEGDWIFIEIPGQPVFKYPVGYPMPVLPTGHRHPAFQLTGDLVAVPKPTALPFMGEAYADRHFMFYGTRRLAVVDLAGDLLVEGSWRWTGGRLEVAVDGDPAGPRSVGWRDLAAQLGKTPAVWKPLAQGTG